MGEPFAARYDASLTAKVGAGLRSAAQRRPIVIEPPQDH
jgi:hypothetical protein